MNLLKFCLIAVGELAEFVLLGGSERAAVLMELAKLDKGGKPWDLREQSITSVSQVNGRDRGHAPAGNLG